MDVQVFTSAGDKLEQYGVSLEHFGVSAAMVDEGCGQAGFSMTATVHHLDRSSSLHILYFLFFLLLINKKYIIKVYYYNPVRQAFQ